MEELETPDLIEAVAVPGADAGQGYGFARPMPVDTVAGWLKDFRLTLDPRHPTTELGRLAQAWLQQWSSLRPDDSVRE
ncbi:MAG: hypothetical protein WCA24_12995 [Thiomonas sp.]